jgi:phosphoribosylanthranilate isomerase
MPKAVDIKICGLTNLEDALAAREAGADFLGFVIYRRSARGITARTLRRIADRLPGAPRVIGVFVNETRDKIAHIASDCGLYAVQLHGDEAADAVLPLPVRVWRSVRLARRGPAPLPGDWPAERYVLDAAAPGMYGGTGKQVNWIRAKGLASRYTIMLAGGLTPGNVATAIRRARPAGVDVASGVEKAPGKKDHRKMAEFIAAARTIDLQII